MKYLKFLLSTTVLVLLLWALSRSWLVGEGAKASALPRLGAFLSPSSGFWQNAEGEAPDLASHISGDENLGPVEVFYDERMVPHIFAQNSQDAAFVQGYTTAVLRLWQMEFQTHAAAGRLTEILGSTPYRREALLKRDIAKRRAGLPRAATKAVELWKKDPAMYAVLQRYADGVNAYISSLSYADYPLEYKILGYAPEPWTVEKTALLLKSMAETLTAKDEDFELTNAYRFWGRERFLQLYPEYFPEQSPIILDSVWTFEPTGPAKFGPPVLPFLGPQSDTTTADSLERLPKGLGSNNWAVGPSRTASGFPMLCNDPHLTLNLPSIWFEVHICTPEYNVYGASLPGAPGVISGFNEHVAWGVTNVAHDVRDWYLIQWQDASRKAYLFDGAYKAAEYIFDTIKVRGQEPYVDTLIYTHWGPIAYSHDGQDYALRWLAHDATQEPNTFLMLNKAKTYEDYLKAISYYACPAQNIVFASKQGDIALWTQGKLPLRRPAQGKFILDGSKSENAWAGYIPQDHIPHEHNPKRGFVGSANQHSVNPNTYPYYYYGYFEEYRGRHLNRRLAEMNKASDQDMKDLQNDNFSQKAKDFLPLFMKYAQRGNLSKDELEVMALVQDWDYNYSKTTSAPTIFEEWFDQVQRLLYDEAYAYNADTTRQGRQQMLAPYEWTTLNLLKRDTLNAIWDIQTTANRETYREVVTEAFRQVCRQVPKDSSGNILDWNRRKNTRILHLAQIEPFSVLNLDVDGDASALNAMTGRNGPSWRMIVELGEQPRGQGVYPGGQSGNPGSRFYTSMLATWAKGEYYYLNFPYKAEEIQGKALRSQSFGSKS